MWYRVAVALVLLAFTASRASAQVPAGGEFRVNSYTLDHQNRAALATDAAGNFVVVWQSLRRQGGSYNEVVGQRYDASGVRRGAEFQVNVLTSGDQYDASVASDAAGNFVVVWATYGGAPGMYDDVVARRFDASGTPRGGEFRVNTFFAGSRQRSPSIATNAASNFVVVWASQFQDGDWWGVFGQRYDASGAVRGAEFQVNTFTTEGQALPSVASDSAGNFVVAWHDDQFSTAYRGVFAQRYDASGTPRGAEFTVRPRMFGLQGVPAVASDPAGNTIITWRSDGQDGDGTGIAARRYDPAGTPQGAEFQVNTYTTGTQAVQRVAYDAAGNFVIAWHSNGQDGSSIGVFGQRYDASGVRRGVEFRVNTYTTGTQFFPSVASDPAGNFVVAWESDGQDGSYFGVFAQRFGGIVPAALAVDTAPSPGSDGNRVFEPGESVDVRPAWRNVNGAAQTFDGGGLGFTGPAAGGVSYQLLDAAGAYGTVPNGATAACSDCYRVGVPFGGTRPSLHWDATFTERLTPDALGQTKPWSIHVGQSFSDVPKTSLYYRDVETLLHKGVTGGCTATAYCPTSPVTREQMAVFTLEGREGAGYRPPACTTPIFSDVPASSFFCAWIEELARRGVASGCGGGNYCPGAAVTREQMPVFVLRLLDPALNPPACTTPVFADVPASSTFCRWIEELARRGVVAGCGGGNYCPTSAVTREQMAVFISVTYGLSLYGP